MIVVIGSLVVLFAIALIKKIPYIGGNIQVALLGGGLAAALLSGMAPLKYIQATIDGIDTLAWVIALSIFGSIYAETQVRIGAMDTTMSFLRILFGKSPRGLIAATFVTLTLAGSLLGDAIAAATVIGFLVIHSLAEMKIKPVQIGMIILLGASLGSIMPPISQAVYLAASLVNTDPDPVTLWSYLTVTIGVILAILESFRFVRRPRIPGTDSSAEFDLGGNFTTAAAVHEAQETRFSQLRTLGRERWASMIPLAVLVIIVLLKTGLGYDIFAEIPGIKQLTAWMNTVPILAGLAFPVVMAIIVATVVSFFFKKVRREPMATVSKGLKNVRQTVAIQLCAAFLIGCFYESGAVDTVSAMAEHVAGSGVAVISTIALMILGMLIGSQTAAQTVVVPFASPILENAGVDPTNIAVGMSHIAASAQNLPPVGLTAFVVCGLVGATLKTKVDPVKVMVLALPNSMYFIILGLLFLLLG
ncbi:TRAP transporter large permease subunit [Brevibacterium sp. UCMA 11752]|uniref:TRAP transporter large permease subunit n=1 Tax=Brevibacterium sp. UCMA 11752 TaxID=2745946 RepID=UPI001F47464F|nr:TRAP transporter large permease subunit [Brevibacterium sp. UCMA 11752]MCF2588658.1 TRAP transporter large permease subunit [Brevibacterium sp. UCMA 11752]